MIVFLKLLSPTLETFKLDTAIGSSRTRYCLLAQSPPNRVESRQFSRPKKSCTPCHESSTTSISNCCPVCARRLRFLRELTSPPATSICADGNKLIHSLNPGRGREGHCCRLLVGMAKLRQDDLFSAFSFSKRNSFD